jgi:hypothetical protein
MTGGDIENTDTQTPSLSIEAANKLLLVIEWGNQNKEEEESAMNKNKRQDTAKITSVPNKVSRAS